VFIIFLQIVGFVLILSPVYSKITDLFTSWPIVGGTIACGGWYFGDDSLFGNIELAETQEIKVTASQVTKCQN